MTLPLDLTPTPTLTPPTPFPCAGRRRQTGVRRPPLPATLPATQRPPAMRPPPSWEWECDGHGRGLRCRPVWGIFCGAALRRRALGAAVPPAAGAVRCPGAAWRGQPVLHAARWVSRLTHQGQGLAEHVSIPAGQALLPSLPVPVPPHLMTARCWGPHGPDRVHMSSMPSHQRQPASSPGGQCQPTERVVQSAGLPYV